MIVDYSFFKRTRNIRNERTSLLSGVSTMGQRIQRNQIDHSRCSKDWLACCTCFSIFWVLHQSFQHFNSKGTYKSTSLIVSKFLVISSEKTDK